MDTTTTDNLAAALREAISFLGCLHASNANAAAAAGRAALAEYDEARNAPKTVMLCPYCGSDDIASDAAARWNGTEWVLSGVHDSTGCGACGEEFDTPTERIA